MTTEASRSPNGIVDTRGLLCPYPFIQGLIQVCAAYHHFQNGNLAGALTLLQRGADKMRRYPPQYLGIDAAGLIAHIDGDRGRIQAIQRENGTNATIDFPRIEGAPR